MENLRKRSQNSTDSVKSEVKKRKPSVVKRSVRIKIVKKDQSNASKKDNQKRNKKKLTKKSVSFRDDVIDNSNKSKKPEYMIDEELRAFSKEISKGPGVVFECRGCTSFFFLFNMFLEHKRRCCPRLTDEQSFIATNREDFILREFYDQFQDSDDSSTD